MEQVLIAPGILEGEYEQAYASGIPIIPSSTGNLNFSSFLEPRDRLDMIRKAKEHRNIELVDRILRLKVDFGMKIKGIRCKNEKQKEFYERYVIPLLNEIIDDWVYEHNSMGDTFLHYGFMQDRIPMFLTIEDPERVFVDSILNKEIYTLRVPSNFREDIKKLIKKKQITNTSNLPLHIKKFILDKTRFDLELTKENMFRTTNLKSRYNRYTYPPLMRIHKAIELRELLTDGDFCAAYDLANRIIHTKVGSDKKYAPSPRVKSIHNRLVSRPPGNSYFSTQHDVSINWVGPDPKIWAEDKYKEVTTRILRWGGVTLTLIDGEGKGYASATVSTKSLERMIESDKRVFMRFVKHWFNLIDRKNGFTDKVKLLFERNALISKEEIMKEIEFLFNRGIYGIEDLCIEFNLDYEEQLEKMKKQKEDEKTFVPHFEPNQGLLENETGRPPTDSNEIKRDTNQPRP